MEITSRDNRLIKEYRRLSDDARYRRQSGKFVVEGARLCADAARSDVVLESVFITPHACSQYPEYTAQITAVASAVYDIPDTLARHLGDTASPQGIYAIAVMPSLPSAVSSLDLTRCYAALETVQDPGNLGTMIRTAEAFGLGGILLSDGCCDPYSPKALRASMGGSFRLPLFTAGDLTETLPRLAERGFRIAACVVDGDAETVQSAALGVGTVAVIGNEGNGLRPETVAACTCRITIPMDGRAESLNASMAAGIVFWEMVRKDGTHRE